MTTETVPKDRPCESCGVDLTESVEDYLKAVFAITSRGDSASTSMIAAHVGVTAPSVTAMLHRLRANGLVEQASWGHVTLTDHGLLHAHEVVRRHRLLETFLHRVLGVAWDEIHDEAERLEHHLSQRLEGLIDAALGFPDRDPHGDPIPGALLIHVEHGETPLASSGPGDVFLVQRVYDSDSDALRQLAALGISPGVALDIGDRTSELGPLRVRVGEQEHVLSRSVVNLIHGEIQTAASA